MEGNSSYNPFGDVRGATRIPRGRPRDQDTAFRPFPPIPVTANVIGTMRTGNDRGKIIITLVDLLLTILSNRTIRDLRQLTNAQYLDLLNDIWPRYYRNDFSDWINGNKRTTASYRILPRNYVEPSPDRTTGWLINREHTLFYWFTTVSDAFTEVNPGIIDGQFHVFDDLIPNDANTFTVKVDEFMPQYTSVEKTRAEKIALLNARANHATPTIRNDNGTQFSPTYIKAIDNPRLQDANVLYFQYEIPGGMGPADGLPGIKYKIAGHDPIIPTSHGHIDGYRTITEPLNVSTNWGRHLINKQRIHVIRISGGSTRDIGHNRTSTMEKMKELMLTKQGAYTKDNANWITSITGSFFFIQRSWPDPAGIKAQVVQEECPEDGQGHNVRCQRQMGFAKTGNAVIPNLQPIPALVQNVYGHIRRRTNGNLEISYGIPGVGGPLSAEIQDSPEVITAGPMLIRNGNNVFQTDKFREGRFCGHRKDSLIRQDRQPAYLPAYLNHASNMNPRSAIGTNANGQIFLVTVEGANEFVVDGMTFTSGSRKGVDLYVLADIMQSLGCNNGINLDGGGTANLLYKLPRSSGWLQTNEKHIFKYPSISLESSNQLSFFPTNAVGGKTKKAKKNKTKKRKERSKQKISIKKYYF
jgi:hypothetical protein